MQTPATIPDRDLLREIGRLSSGFDGLKQLFLSRRFDVLAVQLATNYKSHVFTAPGFAFKSAHLATPVSESSLKMLTQYVEQLRVGFENLAEEGLEHSLPIGEIEQFANRHSGNFQKPVAP